jgi:hypothetical protein
LQTFTAIAQGGQLEFTDPKSLEQFLVMNPGEVFINIGKNRRKRQRSNNQNEYYWGCVLKLISEHTGDTVEDLHDHFRIRFLMRGVKLDSPRSTTSLSTSEFEEYLSKIRHFAQMDLQVFIPLPHENLLTLA